MRMRKGGVAWLAVALACQLPLDCAAAGDIVAGKALFLSLRCASCHAVGPNASSGYGPQLNGIIGRTAGSAPDFQAGYSVAMKKSGIVWTEQSLGKFLNGPSDFIPGTKMSFWGISDPAKIANLLAYLRSVSVPSK